MKTINIIIERRRISLSFAFIVTLSFIVSFFFLVAPSHAVSPSSFKAGNIISDSVFTDKNSMSAQSIQNFLNSKVAACDSNGSQPLDGGFSQSGIPDYNGNGTIQRWEWAKKKYNQTTFKCLRNYTEGGKSAARIIYDYAQSYSISPKVIIVLLQKEQGLVTDTWPLNLQYRSATGYGCPDTAPCDTEYYGFKNQVKWAATMFRAIMNDSPTWYTPYELGNNSIPWHPNTAACGYSTVNILNRATQALYNYTPYRPNTAALNAGYGTGNGCSAYGNRNFWLYFSDWFSSTTTAYDTEVTEVTWYSDASRTSPLTPSENGTYDLSPDQTIYGAIYVKNVGSNNLDRSFTRIGTTSPTDRSSVFRNDSWLTHARVAELEEDVLAPNNTGTFLVSITTPRDVGNFTENFGVVAEQRLWMSKDSINLKINISPNKLYDANLVNYELYYDPEMKAKTPARFGIRPNQKLYLKAWFKNLGSNTVAGNLLKLAPTSPRDHATSPFIDATWNSPTRVVRASESSIATGEIASFVSILQGPVLNGDYTDEFGLVIEGIAWADISKLNMNITVSDTVPILQYGQSLKKGDTLIAGGGAYFLSFQNDGNLVLYNKNKKPLWHTKTYDQAADRVVLQGDGNLVIYTADNRPVWASWTQGTGHSRLRLQSDGNLVIYRNNGGFTWATWTNK